jgi:NosR/NirI family nitrous oxide reductase transcriptional regulator
MKARFKRLSVVMVRACTIASIFACIGVVAHKHHSRATNTLSIQAAELTEWFPGATTIGQPTGDLNATPVLDSSEKILGFVVQTAPASDKIIGYAGPSNILIALSRSHKILGFRILESADTSSHIAKIEDPFWKQFIARSPSTLPNEPITVSGATLTTEAISKSIQARLTEVAAKPWFPREITLTQAKMHFPAVASLQPSRKTRSVHDASGKHLGHLLLSTDCPDQANGFQGPSALLIALSPDEKILIGTSLLASRDNSDYVEATQEELRYAEQFSDQSVDSILADTTLATDKLLVSGASYTATAVVEQLRRSLRWLRAAPIPITPIIHWQLRDTLLTVWLLFAIGIGLTHLRGNKKIRLALQILCIFLGGIYLGTLVSQGLLIGWARNGIPWQTYPALVLLSFASLILPLTTGKNIYCQQICPHGALQNMLFSLTTKKLRIPGSIHKKLTTLPWILLVAIIVLGLLHWTGDFSLFETFDAWSTGFILSLPAVFFILSVVTAPFIRTPYCHYACPTGALLHLAGGPKNHLLTRDTVALIFAILAWIALAF